jgi:glycosyltransferase involved in cell wall biosynthesis
VGELCRDAIESIYAQGPFTSYRQLIKRLADLDSCNNLVSSSDMIQAAQTIAANKRRRSFARLLIDISELVQRDGGTGIHRVVRSVLLELIAHPPANWRVEPIYFDGLAYRYARKFTLNFIGSAQSESWDEPLHPKAGDIYLGLDFLSHIAPSHEPLYARWHNRGVKVYFVVYDLLPILRPDTFPAGLGDIHRAFIASISRVADGLVCISRAVADELMQMLDWIQPQRVRNLDIGYFHLGADIAESAPTTGMGAKAEATLAQIRSRPSFLMVGTIEPRKGHEQTLAAFERLWRKGLDVNLVIIGKMGWLVEALVKHLQKHVERGRRLIWLVGCSDEMLMRLYEECTALLMVSEGEGFGLPLIEAAQHKLPIIARDLPVFKEVVGEHAYYFHGTEPEDLANAIHEWMELKRFGSVPDASDMPLLTWKQSTAQLLNVILGGQWHTNWTSQARA